MSVLNPLSVVKVEGLPERIWQQATSNETNQSLWLSVQTDIHTKKDEEYETFIISHTGCDEDMEEQQTMKR